MRAGIDPDLLCEKGASPRVIRETTLAQPRSLSSGGIRSYPDVTRLVQDPTVEVGVNGMGEHGVTLNIGERMGRHDDVDHLTKVAFFKQIPVRDVVLKELCP